MSHPSGSGGGTSTSSNAQTSLWTTNNHHTNNNANNLPAVVHAIGGSLGSALAFLLLYPLERIRIEIQQSVVGSSQEVPQDEKREKAVATNPDSGGMLPARTQLKKNNDDYSSTSLTKHLEQSKHINHRYEDLWTCLQRLWEQGELYKGAGSLVWTLAISNFVFFGINSWLKKKIQTHYVHHNRCVSSTDGGGTTIPPLLSLLTSCLAGSINVLFTNPLWVTNLRIITNQSTYQTLWQEMLHVSQTMGIQHLWHGTGASLLLVSNPVIQFFCYETLRRIQLQRRRRRVITTTATATATTTLQQPRNYLSPLEAFVLGAFAKAIATVTTYPLQLAQSLLRLQLDPKRQTKVVRQSSTRRKTTHRGRNHNDLTTDSLRDEEEAFPKKSILQCLVQIYVRDGWRGWYTGLNAKLLQTVLTAAFTFLSYEQILAAVYTVHQKLRVLQSTSSSSKEFAR
jgi:adenine nucleotide transporter 17